MSWDGGEPVEARIPPRKQVGWIAEQALAKAQMQRQASGMGYIGADEVWGKRLRDDRYK